VQTSVQLKVVNTPARTASNNDTIRYDTIVGFNVDSKAEYTA